MSFSECWERVQKATGIKNQAELATVIGRNSANISEAKRRDSFPLEWILIISDKYNVSFDYILYGQEPIYRNLKDKEGISLEESTQDTPSQPSSLGAQKPLGKQSNTKHSTLTGEEVFQLFVAFWGELSPDLKSIYAEDMLELLPFFSKFVQRRIHSQRKSSINKSSDENSGQQS